MKQNNVTLDFEAINTGFAVLARCTNASAFDLAPASELGVVNAERF